MPLKLILQINYLIKFELLNFNRTQVIIFAIMHEETNYNLIVVTGPTAGGKTRFGALLANELNSEIISADSRQIYKRMNLGTGKDYDDYVIGDKTIPYHLIDIHEPGYKYNVFEYQQDFTRIFKEIHARGKTPILCGGTGMYIEAVTQNYKLIAVPVNDKLRNELNDKSLPELEEILAKYKSLHNKSDSDTKKRAIRAIEIEEYYLKNPEKKSQLPSIKPIFFGVKFDRDSRRKRITERLHIRLQEGMVEEVKSLLAEGILPENLEYYGLEYKFLSWYLTNKITYDEMVEKLNTAIHQFAKRQMTWFRKMERNGIKIHWLDGYLPMEDKLNKALSILHRN